MTRCCCCVCCELLPIYCRRCYPHRRWRPPCRRLSSAAVRLTGTVVVAVTATATAASRDSGSSHAHTTARRCCPPAGGMTSSALASPAVSTTGGRTESTCVDWRRACRSSSGGSVQLRIAWTRAFGRSGCRELLVGVRYGDRGPLLTGSSRYPWRVRSRQNRSLEKELVSWRLYRCWAKRGLVRSRPGGEVHQSAGGPSWISQVAAFRPCVSLSADWDADQTPSTSSLP